MPIYLPESTDTVGSDVDGASQPSVEALTPKQIVAELDKYVIAQPQAKRAVAIALRNRMRRQQLPADLAEEVAPKNILMIGPTGVGRAKGFSAAADVWWGATSSHAGASAGSGASTGRGG